MTRAKRDEFWFLACGLALFVGYLGACIALISF